MIAEERFGALLMVPGYEFAFDPSRERTILAERHAVTFSRRALPGNVLSIDPNTVKTLESAHNSPCYQ
jgi:hypothetical protein